MPNLYYKSVLVLLLVLFATSCSQGGEESGSPYYFNPYVPEDFPNATYQSEITWFENIGGNDVGSITVYNELTGAASSAQINSKSECYNVIWLLIIIIPIEETCITDYSYIITVPLGVGINNLNLIATDIGGYVVEEKSFSVERVDYVPVSENEPNDSFSLAENVLAPVTISGEWTNGTAADYFLLTAQESREYTMLITSEDSHASVSVYNLSLDTVASSGETFFSGHFEKGGYLNIWLNSGEQVYVLPYTYGNYILGIY
jgi:hypothetical protein